MEVTTVTKLPAVLGSSFERTKLLADFDIYSVELCPELRWDTVSYGENRDVVLFYSEGKTFCEAAICDGKHCVGNLYPVTTRVAPQELATVLKSYPRPTGPVFSSRRRTIYFSKKVRYR